MDDAFIWRARGHRYCGRWRVRVNKCAAKLLIRAKYPLESLSLREYRKPCCAPGECYRCDCIDNGPQLPSKHLHFSLAPSCSSSLMIFSDGELIWKGLLTLEEIRKYRRRDPSITVAEYLFRHALHLITHADHKRMHSLCTCWLLLIVFDKCAVNIK